MPSVGVPDQGVHRATIFLVKPYYPRTKRAALRSEVPGGEGRGPRSGDTTNEHNQIASALSRLRTTYLEQGTSNKGPFQRTVGCSPLGFSWARTHSH